MERIAHGVYRLRGSADPGHLSLRAVWLQLDPATPAWERLDRSARPPPMRETSSASP